MGVVLASERFGGQYSTTFSVDAPLGWSATQRAVVLYPTASSKTITLVAASRPEIPYGSFIWVVINGHATTSFTLTDGNWSKTIGGNEAAIIAKVDNNGTPEYYCDKREVLN